MALGKNPRAPADDIMKPSCSAVTRYGRAPGWREMGPEIECSLELDRVEDIRKRIHLLEPLEFECRRRRDDLSHPAAYWHEAPKCFADRPALSVSSGGEWSHRL